VADARAAWAGSIGPTQHTSRKPLKNHS
jgi:hypothetical protein